LDVAEFERILGIGLGRAVLYLQNHDSAPYRDVILDTCLHNKALDKQVEGSRAQYMIDVIQKTTEHQFYIDRVFETLLKLRELSDDFIDYDVGQVFDFARLLASQGNTHAREVVYEAFNKNVNLDDFTSAATIIELDGLKGFQFVAKRLGEIAQTNLDFVGDDYLLFELEEQIGSEAAKAALDEFASQNDRIATYLKSVWEERNQRQESRERIQRQTVTYTQLKQEIADPSNLQQKSVGRLREWGKVAQPKDIRHAAVDLLALPDDQPEQILTYLRIFDKRRFPLEIDRLLGWARQLDDRPIYPKDSRLTDRIPFWAYRALLNIAHPQVRTLAFELIEKPAANVVGRAVQLLANNYQEGDWQLIEEISRRDLDREDYHSLGFAVEAVFEMYPLKAAVPTLLNLYDRGPCANCRHRIVERLHWLGALPDWMTEECKFDSNLDLRRDIAKNFE
jgi:hypothetical protein